MFNFAHPQAHSRLLLEENTGEPPLYYGIPQPAQSGLRADRTRHLTRR